MNLQPEYQKIQEIENKAEASVKASVAWYKSHQFWAGAIVSAVIATAIHFL